MLKNYKILRFKIIKLKKIKFINRNFVSKKRYIDAMRAIFGINYFVSLGIVRLQGYSFNSKIEFINSLFLLNVSDFFINYLLVERGLKKFINNKLLEKNQIGLSSGYRLFKGLPVNGQRTHSNAKTVRRLLKNNSFGI